ncbi:unnamed protein product [Dovyalis caffra]|uniref:Mei2-like C-terminal RNA recognition motif domain-containing protein n=1 Tax=Dovyalis caffra TaxID=77055 RepID=A0AAV1S957_9ROSI|nr:unnamed protein product [Dovyalis caffra]
MASKAPNPKPLNPSASPFMRAETALSSSFLPPNSEMIVLPSKLFQLSHEIYGSHPQQQSQLTWEARPAPTVVPGFSPNPYLSFQHQYTQAWVFQEATAYYNIHKQPYTVPYLPPYYRDGGDRGTYFTPSEDLKESDAVKVEEKVKCDGYYSVVLGNKEKRVFSRGARRFVAPPRLRAKRKNGGGFSAEKSWVPKIESKWCEESSVDRGLSAKEDDGVLASAPVDDPDDVLLAGKTTLMIKNVPNQLGRRANLGYAFVNFTNVVGASRFWKAFNKYKWNVGSNRKTCEVSWATIQGKDALCNRYKNSVFPCHSNSYLPVVLLPARDGWRQSTPRLVGKRVGPASPLARGVFRRKKSVN